MAVDVDGVVFLETPCRGHIIDKRVERFNSFISNKIHMIKSWTQSCSDHFETRTCPRYLSEKRSKNHVSCDLDHRGGKVGAQPLNRQNPGLELDSSPVVGGATFFVRRHSAFGAGTRELGLKTLAHSCSTRLVVLNFGLSHIYKNKFGPEDKWHCTGWY